MKHLKKFENFENPKEEIFREPQEIDEIDTDCHVCNSEEEEEDTEEEEDSTIWGDEPNNPIVDSFSNFLTEEKKKLTDKQRNEIDMNKNGKIDAEDFEILRKKKKPVESLRSRILKSQSKN